MLRLDKTKIISLLILSAFVLLIVIGKNKEKENEISSIDNNIDKTRRKIIIAACPTCREIAEKLDSQKYQIIATRSTSESVELMENKRADFVLAGRTLKYNEPRMEGVVIDRGFSFIGSQEFSIQESELKDYQIYTDLDVDLIKNSFPVEKIEKVNDIYQYLEKGIAVTSWENTDYSRADIVHLLEGSGERVRLSRQPTLYCPSECNAEIIAEINSAL